MLRRGKARAGVVSALALTLGGALSSSATLSAQQAGSTTVAPSNLAAALDSAGVPGAQVSWLTDGVPGPAWSYGVRSTEADGAVDSLSVFEAASLTKPVVAYAALRMVDRGLLELDRPLHEYLPHPDLEGDPRGRFITGRMVLSHSTGLPNWRRGDPLTIGSEPGTQFGYSGEGFVFLQTVMERLSGSTLSAILQEEVLGPLGMRSSAVVWRPEYEGRIAMPHGPFGTPGTKGRPDSANAAWSLHTTSADYARFMAALISGSRLTAETRQAMFEPVTPVEDGVDWGLGIGLERDGRIAWHWGDNSGYKALTMVDLESGNGFVYLSNSDHGLAVGNRLAQALSSGPHPALEWLSYPALGSPDWTAREAVDGARFQGANGILAAYTRISEAHPDHDFGRSLLERPGQALVGLGQAAEGLRLLERNVQLHPESGAALASLARARLEAGDTAQARSNLERAVRVEPGNRRAAEMLAELIAGESAPVPAGSWPRIERPEQLGWSSQGLSEADQVAESVGSAAYLVAQGGTLVHAWGAVEQPFNLHSIRKSILGSLLGTAAARGEIDLTTTVDDLGLEARVPLDASERSAHMVDLLTSRSGIYLPAAYETPGMQNNRPERGSHAPGSFFYYNNWDFNALGTVYKNVTGRDLFDAFTEELAGPLGMEDFQQEQHTQYWAEEVSVHPAYVFRLSARDLARFGLLYLRGGRWGERQMVPEAWVERSTWTYSDIGLPGGFGYLWWTAPEGRGYPYVELPYGSFSARGTGPQLLVVIPAYDLVVVHRIDTDNGDRISITDFGRLLASILSARPGSEGVR